MRVVGLLLVLVIVGAALLYALGSPDGDERAEEADSPLAPEPDGSGATPSLRGSGRPPVSGPGTEPRKPREVEALVARAQTGDTDARRAALRALSKRHADDTIPLEWLVEWALFEIPEGESPELVDWALALLAEDKWDAQDLLPGILATALGASAAKQEAVARVVEALEEVAPADMPAIVRIFEHEQSEYGLKRVLLEAMRELGEDALPAAPGLIAFAAEAMEDRVADEEKAAAAGIDVSWDLVEYDIELLLSTMGKSVVPLLVQRLLAAHRTESAVYDVLLHARDPASVLAGALAGAGEAGLRALIMFLQDSNARRRSLAVYALVLADAPDELVRGPLLAALQDVESDIRAQAAEALGEYGNASVPALLRALEDEDLRVRKAAAASLAKLDVEPQDALGPLVRMLAGDDDVAALAAAETLASFGAGAVSVLPKLVARLATEDEWFRGHVALAVATVAVHDPEAFAQHWAAASKQIRRGLVRALETIVGGPERAASKPGDNLDPRFMDLVPRALGDGDLYVRVHAARLRAAGAAGDVLPVLAQGFRASDGHVRTIATQGLAALGRPALRLLPEMLKRVAQDDLYTEHSLSEKWALDRAIRVLGPFDLPRMFAVLDHQVSILAHGAKRTFLAAGPAGFKWLASAWPGARHAQKLAALDVVRDAFRERGAAAQPLNAAASRLAELALQDADILVRVKAVHALEPDAPSFELRLNALIGLLDAQDAKVANGAARSLSELGERVRPVAAQLEARKDHRNQGVRRAIRSLLQLLEDTK